MNDETFLFFDWFWEIRIWDLKWLITFKQETRSIDSEVNKLNFLIKKNNRERNFSFLL